MRPVSPARRQGLATLATLTFGTMAWLAAAPAAPVSLPAFRDPTREAFMSWLQIRLAITPDQAEALEDQLLDLGAVSVTLKAYSTPLLIKPSNSTVSP